MVRPQEGRGQRGVSHLHPVAAEALERSLLADTQRLTDFPPGVRLQSAEDGLLLAVVDDTS